MPSQIISLQLDSMSAVNAVGATLRKIDERLVNHGERVAYIACELCRYGNLKLDLKTLFLLSIFHDVGAYKTEEIDRMVEFETKDVWNHSIYGYLFLKYLSPLGECAKAILYHHCSWKEIQEADFAYANYAALIHFADRIDIVSGYGENSPEFFRLSNNIGNFFCPEYVHIFQDYYSSQDLFQTLKDEEYKEANIGFCKQLDISSYEALEYLKMIVFSIDFRSEYTVTHSINTISIALNIARHFNIEGIELEKIYLASLLHDVGKIAIPVEILEYPGKLSDDQMKIMRTHVKETEKLIRNVIPDEICEMAIRHHEKLDGSGYPRGLREEDLTFSQRIIAVADIVSALNSRRSYKEAFQKEKTVSILNEMSKKQLDKTICSYICNNYDDIIRNTEYEREKIIQKYQSIFNEFEELKKM